MVSCSSSRPSKSKQGRSARFPRGEGDVRISTFWRELNAGAVLTRGLPLRDKADVK